MPFILLLLAVPVGEVFIFLEVGSVIGTWPTIGLIVGTAVAGGMILRWQGLQTLARARRQLAANRLPVAEMAEGAALALAAVLLLTPGFFTDALGTLLLFPPLRRSLLRRLIARLAPQARHAGADDASGADGARVIEGEYTVLDDAPEPGPPGARPNGGNR
ncbi:MAG: FxsA family protein [Rhodospirillales bacterium]|nr:FxsA family protein [Rhodospirillales bacterium]